MERVVIMLLLVYGANAGFMDRLNDLYARWNSGSNQNVQHVFAQNNRQNLVTADQLLPDELMHQQILGPQLAAAGYSGAQIIAGPIAVPLKNLPRPPGLPYQQQPSPPQVQQSVHQQQRPKQPAPVTAPHQHVQYQPQVQQPVQNYQAPTQPPLYAPQPVQYQQAPQQKPVLKYQPPPQYQHPAGQYQPTSPPLQYQAPASSVQYHTQPAQSQYQASAPSVQYQPQPHNKAHASDSSYAAAQQPVVYQQPLPYAHNQGQAYPKQAPLAHQNYAPPAVQQKPANQQYAVPQQYYPPEPSKLIQSYHHVQQYQQPEVQHYPSVPAQQASPSHQAAQAYRPAAPLSQPSYQNVAQPPPLPPKQPVYQHVQKNKIADPAHVSLNYQHTSQNAAAGTAAGAQYYPGQVLAAENHVKAAAFDHASPVKYQNSEWTPIPKQHVESSTVSSHLQGSEVPLLASASVSQNQQVVADISDADLQNLNFNHVFDGVVPDIPEIPHGFDFSALSNMSGFGNFDPSLLGLLDKDPSALAQLKDPSALSHLKDPKILAQFKGNPQALSAFSSQASSSNQVAQAKKDSFVPEAEKLPAQGRSSEGPVRTSESVKVSVKKLKSKSSSKNDTLTADGKPELTKVKRKKATDGSGKVVKSITVSASSESVTSSSTTVSPSDSIITASWKTEKPHAVPRIGEGIGRFVGRVLPAEDSEVAPVKSSAQLSDGIFVSNVGYSIKFTSRR